MSSTSDPTRTWQRRTRWTWGLAAPCVLAAAVWAVVVPDRAALKSPDLDAQADDLITARTRPIDVAVFDAPLWVDPPVEVVQAPARPPPPPPPVTLQLLAVVRVPATESDPARLQAAIYDPESDRLRFVSDGERVGRFTITAVHDRGAQLTDGARDVELLLTEGSS